MEYTGVADVTAFLTAGGTHTTERLAALVIQVWRRHDLLGDDSVRLLAVSQEGLREACIDRAAELSVDGLTRALGNAQPLTAVTDHPAGLTVIDLTASRVDRVGIGPLVARGWSVAVGSAGLRPLAVIGRFGERRLAFRRCAVVAVSQVCATGGYDPRGVLALGDLIAALESTSQ